MSVSPYTQFSSAVLEADPNLIYIANKLPKKGMESFDIESSGKFTIVYESENTGSASHTEKAWEESLKDVTVKVDKVVKGTIVPGTESEPGRIDFESGIVVTKKTKWPLPDVNISLSSVKAVADSTDILVTGKWGFLSRQAVVSQSTINFTQVDWKV